MARTASAIGAALLLAQQLPAAAPQWGGSVTLASDHLLRGVSRSDNQPSLQAEVHLQGRPGWFAGLWAATSRARPQDDTAVDVAATLGAGGALAGDWSWRGSFTHYRSPWHAQPDWYRYSEVTLDLQLRDLLLLSASWSPDAPAYSPYFGAVSGRDAFAYELGLQQPLGRRWRAHAGIGYHDLDEYFGEGYWYGSAGVGWTQGRWQADLSYVHPGAAARRLNWPGSARRRALATVSWAF